MMNKKVFVGAGLLAALLMILAVTLCLSAFPGERIPEEEVALIQETGQDVPSFVGISNGNGNAVKTSQCLSKLGIAKKALMPGCDRIWKVEVSGEGPAYVSVLFPDGGDAQGYQLCLVNGSNHQASLGDYSGPRNFRIDPGYDAYLNVPASAVVLAGDAPFDFERDTQWEDGFNMGKNGIRSGKSGEVSSFIPVDNTKKLYARVLARSNWAALAFYDKDRQFLKKVNLSTWGNDRPFQETDYTEGPIEIPDKALYVRVCRYKKDYLSRFIISYYWDAQYLCHDESQLEKVQTRALSTKSGELALTARKPANEGVANMVRNAYQMSHLKWTPTSDVAHNNGNFPGGEEALGLPYSSAKEIYTYVPQYVSFETFMTAVHNPRSVLYRIKLDEAPYSGSNCRAYYGGVCATLVCYAMGWPHILNSGQFLKYPDLFERVGTGYEMDLLEIGDILQSDEFGHVVLVTGIWTDPEGHPVRFEITEEDGTRAVTQDWDSRYVEEWFRDQTFYAMRYKKAAEVQYVPNREFVALDGETPIDYKFNRFLYPDRGNKSLYLEKDPVVLNLFTESPVTLEVFKDGEPFRTVQKASGDVSLGCLPYGRYQARVKTSDGKVSDDVFFKVINVVYSYDKALNRISFSSANATVKLISFCKKGGGNAVPTGDQNNFITPEEMKQGYKDFNFSFKDNPNLYFRIHCWDEEDDYGKIITRNVQLGNGREAPAL